MRGSQKCSFYSLARDFLIHILPAKKLPLWFVDFLYGGRIDFIFLVHPRDTKDIYATIPGLAYGKKIIPEKTLRSLLALIPLYSVATVSGYGGVRGAVMSTSFLPQVLFADREATLKELGRIVRFIRKLSRRSVYVGLAAWWPIVTNSGLAFKRFLNDDDAIIITNGHTATLLSIYLTVERIASVSAIPLSDLKVLILGAGRVGAACGRLLNGKVRSIGIVDTNEARGNTVRQELEGNGQKTAISVYVASDVFLKHSLPHFLSEYDITICTASNTNYIIEDSAKLKECIIIDDSRPEAFPRVISEKNAAVVIEGGLIKFTGIRVGADFGFGNSDNVFGCMAESIMLALDNMNSLKPTIGEVEFSNFSAMAGYCKERGITEGVLMSGKTLVPHGLIRSIIARKHNKAYARA